MARLTATLIVAIKNKIEKVVEDWMIENKIKLREWCHPLTHAPPALFIKFLQYISNIKDTL
jgi:hypothetical protein